MEEDIFGHMKKMKRQVEKSFNEFWEKPKLLALPTMELELAGFKEPAGEISVKGGKVIAKLKMPGMDMKDLALNVFSDFIEVKAEKRSESKQEGKGFFKQEGSFQGFYRKLPLPVPVNPKGVISHFSNGVLEITMPKAALPEKKEVFKLK